MENSKFSPSTSLIFNTSFNCLLKSYNRSQKTLLALLSAGVQFSVIRIARWGPPCARYCTCPRSRAGALFGDDETLAIYCRAQPCPLKFPREMRTAQSCKFTVHPVGRTAHRPPRAAALPSHLRPICAVSRPVPIGPLLNLGPSFSPSHLTSTPTLLRHHHHLTVC